MNGLSGATQIAAGAEHTCALVVGGQVRCWGADLSGQLGSGTSGNSSSPVAVSGLSGAVRITVGGEESSGHSCALVAGGQVRCWGNNSNGQLGNGFTTSSPTLVAVSGLSGATQISAGAGHSCGLVAGGQLRCWGDNASLQLGFSANFPTPVAVVISL